MLAVWQMERSIPVEIMARMTTAKRFIIINIIIIIIIIRFIIAGNFILTVLLLIFRFNLDFIEYFESIFN